MIRVKTRITFLTFNKINLWEIRLKRMVRNFSFFMGNDYHFLFPNFPKVTKFDFILRGKDNMNFNFFCIVN